MKQLVILDRQLNVKKLGLVKNAPTVFDTISPQKTTLELLKDESVNIGDIVSIKQYDTQEFLGIVQDVAVKNKTELYVYPFINAFNCECTMESINGYVYDWIVATMEANFVNIADNSLTLNLEFRNMMTLQPSLSYIFSDGNLFEALKKIFYITGVYLEFSLKFVNGIATAIYCDIYNTNDYGMITVRYDNPLLSGIPVIENSMNAGVNKIILKPEEIGTTYAFYLLDDNTVTTDQSASGRIKPVNQKIARYADETSTEELQLIAEKELLGEAYDHNIYFTIKKNDSYEFELYRKVKFINKDRTYVSYCSKIDKTQDNMLGITLGVIRNNLTDKIKDLEAQTSSLTSATSTGSGAIIPVLQWGNIGGSINTQADLKNALAGKIPTTEKGVALGVATLGADGKLASAQMPFVRVSDTFTVSSQAEMLALEADEGDVAKRTDLGKSFILNSGSPTILSSWIPMIDDFEPLGAVSDHNASETAHSTLFGGKVDKISGKELSTNDFTDTLKNRLDGIEAGAQVNVIETVKVNGTALTPTAKAVDVTVPTKTSDLTNDSGFITDTPNIAKLDTAQTFTKVNTFDAPTNIAGTEQATTWFNTANGGRVGFGKEGPNSGTGIFFEQVVGTRRLNFRSSASIGEMVWSQPEEGARLYIDLGLAGSDYHRITMPSSAGTLALTSQIPVNSSFTLAGLSEKSYNSLTDKPTIPTKLDDLIRINKQGYISSGSQYFELATLPIDNSGNYASVIFSGRIGGWVGTANVAYFTALLSNRSNYTGNNITASIEMLGKFESALSIATIVAYKQADLSTKLYLKASSYYTFDFSFQKYQSTVTYNYTGTAVTPTGTLIWDMATAPKFAVDTTGQISNGTYKYYLPSSAGTLALTSDIPSISDFLVASNIKEGTNITLSVSGKDVTINSTAGGGGTVTSVGITAGSGISVSGSPVTSSGNITVNNTGVLSIGGGNGNVLLGTGLVISIAEPSGVATIELNSHSVTTTNLWTTSSATTGNKTLSSSIQNFDYIAITGCRDNARNYTYLIPVSLINAYYGTTYGVHVIGDGSCRGNFSDDTHFNIVENYYTYFKRIDGIKMIFS